MLILSILLVALGMGAAIWKGRELPESVSAMVWLLPKGGWRWLWMVWLLMADIFTLAPAIEILDAKNLGVLGFLPMVLMAFVAVWPLFDTEHRKWHNAFGIAAGVATQPCVWFICPWWLFGWLLIPAAIIAMYCQPDRMKWLDGKGVTVAEIICYVTLNASVSTYILTS